MTSGIIEYAARERVKLRVDGDALVVSYRAGHELEGVLSELIRSARFEGVNDRGPMNIPF